MLALAALVLAGALGGALRLRNQDDLMVFLPAHDPDVRLFSEVSRRFGALRVALIGVEAPAGQDVFVATTIEKLARATQAIRNLRGIDHVLSLTSVSDIVPGPLGAQVVNLVEGPPADAAAHDALLRKVLSREQAVGNLVSADGRATLLMVFLADPGAPGEAPVEAQVHAVALRELGGLKVYFGGAPFASRAIYQEAQRDVWRLSPLALLVLLLVVVVAFRDPVGVALTIGSVAFAVGVVLGGMGWLGIRFTVATATLPVILFASGSSYAVHVLGRYYLLRADHDPAAAIATALRIVGPPLAIAAATTAVGFFSFVATDVAPMRQFGLACGAGVLLCWLTSLTLVPAVVALWPRRHVRPLRLDKLGRALWALWRFSQRHRRFIFVGAMALGALCARPMLRVDVHMEPRAFFRPGSEPWQADRFLEEHFGGATFAQVWLTGDFDDPATLRELARLCDFARAQPGVAQVSSLLLPLRLADDGMDNMPVLPWRRQQASNLFLLIAGQAGIGQLVTPDRHDALVQVRLRGDPQAAVARLETFVRQQLRQDPRPPTARDVAERLSWMAEAQGRTVPLATLLPVVEGLRPPPLADPEWTSLRGAVIDEYLRSEEAPPLGEAARAQVRALALATPTGSPELQRVLAEGAPSVEEGRLAYAYLLNRLDEAHRHLAWARAVPRMAAAAGLPADGPARAHLVALADDLFVHFSPDERARRPLSARVAGEPILDRGFSRSVGDNQVRSLLVAVGSVLLLLLLLFRSLRLALLALWSALLTLALLFGIMGYAGVPIDLGTSLVAGIATGAGSDFAMHYLWYLREQSAETVCRSVGPVMVVSVALVALGFWVLALGRSPVMHLFGTLAGLAMALSALLTCLLVPAVLNKVEA